MTVGFKYSYNKIQVNRYLKAPDVLFMTGEFLYVMTLVMDTTMWTFSGDATVNSTSFLMKILRYISYAIMMVKIIYSCDVEYKGFKYLLLTGMITGFAFLTSRNMELVFYFLFFFAARGISCNLVIGTSMVAQSAVTLITIAASVVGLVNNYITDKDDRIREFLGFKWATTSALIYSFVVLELLYLWKGRIRLLNYVIINVINYFLYVLTDSRMAFLLCIGSTTFFLLFGGLIGQFRERKWFTAAMVSMPFLLAAGSIYLHKRFTREGMIGRINVLLSNRLRYGYEAMKSYGIGLFGKKIKWVGYGLDDAGAGKYNYVDCSYLRIAIEYGVLFLIMVLLVYSFIIYRAYKNGQNYLAWITLFILMLCVTESRLFNFAFNPFILLAFATMTKKNKNGQLIS